MDVLRQSGTQLKNIIIFYNLQVRQTKWKFFLPVFQRLVLKYGFFSFFFICD